ncbi:7TM diverse intracellular signaling domain-containing protein [Winogradskyella sp.]|uniref:sensor histidine kinase n=1 Tax=Winogradskyella sp. TaxID=1883156 RepID=UPI003517F9A8
MKTICYRKHYLLLLFFAYLSISGIKAQNIDTLYLGSLFENTNIKSFSKINGKKPDARNFFYFSFQNNHNAVEFSIKNTQGKRRKLVLEFSNALIRDVILLKKNGLVFNVVGKTGINYPVSEKPTEHRRFAFPISLEPYESATYQIQLKKEEGKPLVTSVYLKSLNTFNKHNSIQQTIIGVYYGVSILSILFSFFVFYISRKASYLIYALYIIFLGLFLSAYTGVFSQLFLGPSDYFSKYKHYVLFSEISMLLFVVFSQKILEARTHMPKLKKAVDILLVLLVSIRLLIHFVFKDTFETYISIFMNLWYGIFIVLSLLIAVEIILYFKTNFKRSSLFAFAYFFMIAGTCVTILYHSYGVLNTMIYGLPLIFYSSFFEIIFLTFTVIFMVKDVYDERNDLSEKLIIEEKKNLTAFIKGEDKERKRISKELHDNIGSQLGYLKRFVSDKFKDEKINNAIDTICNDVRTLSHEISPSDLGFVGLENAVSDLAKNLSDQTSLQVDFNSFNFPKHLSEETETQLYRIIQEALNNIFKHANAKHIDIQFIGHPDSANISIEDDGKGIGTINNEEGLGIKNMKSRTQQVGGTIEIDSNTNKGTSIIITIPIRKST